MNNTEQHNTNYSELPTPHPLRSQGLCAVGERLLDVQIRHQHAPHHVVLPTALRHRLEGRVPIATEMQQPQVLRPYLLADELNLALAVPLRASDPARSHSALDFDGVLVVVRDAPRHLTVPCVPVP